MVFYSCSHGVVFYNCSHGVVYFCFSFYNGIIFTLFYRKFCHKHVLFLFSFSLVQRLWLVISLCISLWCACIQHLFVNEFYLKNLYFTSVTWSLTWTYVSVSSFSEIELQKKHNYSNYNHMHTNINYRYVFYFIWSICLSKPLYWLEVEQIHQ